MSSKLTTAWTNDASSPFHYRKILVAAIVDYQNDSLRLRLEQEVCNKLSALGYYAVASNEEFGPKGLKSLGQEATYLTLCENGIDAVMTIALLPARHRVAVNHRGDNKYTNGLYYDHIWNFHTTQEPLLLPGKLSWELILFDVTRLQPDIVLQTGLFPEKIAKMKAGTFIEQAIGRMVKEKLLFRTDTTMARKPF